jgi:predicted unusual protein kinase regulating ubiquinone biosynthesis (AarF/ABC1/UbiB family)
MLTLIGINEYFNADPILRRRLAEIGLNSFFKMFLSDNFIHADCHAGNLLVQKLNRKEKKIPYHKRIYNKFENHAFYFFNKVYYSAQVFYLDSNIK